MPWKCPACGTQIRHSDNEPMPRVGLRYRCHICRLELMVDPRTEKLVLAPIAGDDPQKSQG